MNKVLCANCGLREAMPALPKIEPVEMWEDEEDKLPVDVVYLKQIQRREKEIRRRLRKAWLEPDPKKKDEIVGQVVSRMEE